MHAFVTSRLEHCNDLLFGPAEKQQSAHRTPFFKVTSCLLILEFTFRSSSEHQLISQTCKLDHLQLDFWLYREPRVRLQSLWSLEHCGSGSEGVGVYASVTFSDPSYAVFVHQVRNAFFCFMSMWTKENEELSSFCKTLSPVNVRHISLL